MKRLLAFAAVVAAVLVTSVACGLLSPPPQAPPAPPVIVNNTSSGDGGLMVLLTVALGVGLLAVVASVTFGLLWASERRRRGAAEDAVAVLTGRCVSESALMTARQLGMTPLLMHQLPAVDSTATPLDRRAGG